MYKRKRVYVLAAIIICVFGCLINCTYMKWSIVVVEGFGTVRVPSSWSYESFNGQLNFYDKNGDLAAMQLKFNQDVGACFAIDGEYSTAEDVELISGGVASNYALCGKVAYKQDGITFEKRAVQLNGETYFVFSEDVPNLTVRKIARSYLHNDYYMLKIKNGIENKDKEAIEGLFADVVKEGAGLSNNIDALLELFPDEFYPYQWIDGSNMTFPQVSVQQPQFSYNVFMFGYRYKFILVDYLSGSKDKENQGLCVLYITNIENDKILLQEEIASHSGIIIDLD